jgi:hypothetical protein
MSQMRAIKGLVLGSVAVLVAALAVILLQVARGPGGLRVPQGGMVTFVPEGAVCLVHLDVRGVLDTPLARGMATDPDRQAKLADAMAQVHSLDAFVLTPQAGSEAGDPPALCGVVRVGPETFKEFRDLMAREGKRVKVGGATAYRVVLPRQNPFGFNVPAGGSTPALFMALAGGNAVAFATTQRGFGVLAGAMSGLAPSSDGQLLADMAAAAGEDPFWLAFAGKEAMEAAGQRAKELPECLKGAQGAVLSVAVDEDIQVRGLLRLASAAAAAEALAMAQAGLDSTKAGLQEGTAPPGVPVAAAAVVLNRTSLSASGTDVRVTVDLTGEELGQMIGAVLMGALAGGMRAQPTP